MLAIPLLLTLPLAFGQSDSNAPPTNDSATNPWWPQYPTGRDQADYMLNESASDADLRGETDIAKWIIEASNMWRAEFSSGPVTWNETAARIAQNHTNTCLWEHWGSDNLAQQSGSVDSMRFDVRSMIEMWAVEWDYYPFNHPEEEAYSHFTAMTWNASTTVGCGWNINCQNQTDWPSKTYFVCNYWPPGNVMTQPPGRLFALNVKNFTGWPVDEAKESSLASLIGTTTPTAQTNAPATLTVGAGGATTGSPQGSNDRGGSGAGALKPAFLFLSSALAAAAGSSLL